MERKVRFWSRYVGECLESVLVIFGIFVAISLLTGHRTGTFRFLVSQLRMFLLISVAIIYFFLNSSAQIIYIPLLLSHGETRKSVFIGHIAARFAVFAITGVISGGMICLSGDPEAWSCFPTEMLLLLILCALGGIMATLSVKSRTIGMLIYGIACVGVGITAGVVVSSFEEDGELLLFLQEFLLFTPWWLYVIAAVFVFADVCFHWAVLRCREVRL